ncbi:MAG TPA: maleylpyruvate isomerase family mycothiol-dependent enzyme [Chloroflexota bacterium]
MAQQQFNAASYANKAEYLRVVRNEAGRFVDLVSAPGQWEAPTASGHWQVRDLAGHLVDVIEGYLDRFETARRGGDAPSPLGLRIMAQRLDEHALSFRSIPRADLLARLNADIEKVFRTFDQLDEKDWTGLTPSHPYMGPVPAFMYPAFQLMDYAVHGWDIREGQGATHGLSGDAADWLVPFMFIVWQATTDLGKAEGVRGPIGVRVHGRNGGTFRISVTPTGYAYEPGSVDDLPAVLDFDAASLVLTAFGRVRAGTAYGDSALADAYRGIFFAI